MKSRLFLFLFVSGNALFSLYTLNPAKAEIVPDKTLPSNSIVTSQGNTSVITGGTRTGSNLFHSFAQFSVLTNGTAYFNNTPEVQNIISRVTGSSISNIDGLLKANGTANLFLINPNGIIFGPNARLDIGGSFLGTTASSINFADGTQFSAKDPQATPLLTISVPIGLGFGTNSGAIQVQGDDTSLSGLDSILSPIISGISSTGFSVQPGKTLALVGSDVILDGRTLTAEGGQIELGSVGSGSVSLNPTSKGWTLGYQGMANFKDIQLSKQALVDASGPGGGSIEVQGANVTLTDGSVILIQNQGDQPSGSLKVNASESLVLSGTSPNGGITSSLRTEPFGSGNGGDIAVSTRRFVLQGGAGIGTITNNDTKGGNLTVNASEYVQLLGFSPVDPSRDSNIQALSFSSGKAGDITISTGRLTAIDGGFVASSTLMGTGAGGDVTVNATNFIELIGVNQSLFAPSLLGATTFNAGKAGNLKINTSRLVARDGGRVDTSTAASGPAGNLTINASDSLEVSGTVPGSVNPSLVSSSANILDPIVRQIFELPQMPSGASGDVTINTGRLRVTDGGQVSVRNDGSGKAGNLRVNARSIFVDNQGSITAATASGEGGNILLNAQNLQLRHSSLFTVAASGSGNGGNITINTGTLAALESSPITANAYRGRGGNIQITAQGIFRSPDSAITASSRLGINGTVQVNALVNNSTLAIAPLPIVTVDPAHLIAQGCPANVGQRASKFIVTGSGGLPPSPSDLQGGDTVWADLGSNASSKSGSSERSDIDNIVPSTEYRGGPLVEAQGWVTNSKGEVVFTASAPSLTPDVPWLAPTTCRPQ